MAATAVQLMKIQRDPAQDPQPGDLFRVPGGYQRMIVARKHDRVQVEYGDRRIWLRLEVWRRKCAAKEIIAAPRGTLGAQIVLDG